MKLYRFIAAGFMLSAGVAASACFAQSSNDQQETIAQSGTAQAAVMTATPATPPAELTGKTREQVMRELIEFQNSPQAAQLIELYRGGN